MMVKMMSVEFDDQNFTLNDFLGLFDLELARILH